MSDLSTTCEEKKNDSEEECSERRNGSEASVCTLMIAGHVEGHSSISPPLKATKYEEILPQLVAVEQDKRIDGLLVILNTAGGDVEAGLAIAEVIASMEKPVVSLITGGGHSIGIPMAVAADVSFIAPSSSMTLHPVRINGLVIGASQTFSYFKQMQERITDFIVSHSHIKKSVLEELIYSGDHLAGDLGTIINGREAVEYGLIDKVGGLKDALRAIERLKKGE